MPKPICEDLITRPSAQPDYLEIGTLSADGVTFTPVSVVGAGLPRESQLYYVAAEGSCSIRGQDMVGATVPAPVPDVVPAEPVATIQPAMAPAVDTPPASAIGVPDFAVWGMIGLVVVGAIASAWVTRNTRAQDKTPGQSYSVKLGGDSDGRR
jgi:hypothetical protein